MLKSKEIWKDIKGYKLIYQVSNFGNIKRLKGYGCKKEHLLKPNISATVNYLLVCLCKNGKAKRFLLHRLVALNFLNNLNNYPQVCHKDGNPKNNNLENLYWGNQSMNEEDKKRHGTWQGGENNGYAKLSETQVIKIRLLYKRGKFGYLKVAKMFGVSSSTIRNIILRKIWKHIR